MDSQEAGRHCSPQISRVVGDLASAPAAVHWPQLAFLGLPLQSLIGGSGDSWESDLGIWGQKKKSILSTKAQMGWILPKVLHNPWFVYFLSDSLRWETVFIVTERRGLHRPGLGIRSPMAGGSFRPVLEDNLLFRKKLYIWFKPMFKLLL